MGFNVCPLRGRETYNGIKLKSLSIIFTVIYVILSTPEVAARGRMMEPTQRSSLWLRGYDSPRNDDDTGLNCGGRWAQHGINNGKCGVCGDRYDVTPRPNEPGGTYANGIIANTYTTDDQSIHVVIDIQSFLGGYFEFRICPHNNPHTSVSQGCLDQHQLRVWDVMSNDEPKYQYIPKRVGLHRLRVEMPTGMTCTQCVLQWKWRTAKDWGKCPDGNARLGCGPQEEFYNCADISIEKATASNQRLTLPEVTLTNSNEPISFDNSALTFDQGNDFPNVPMSFLPQEVLQAGNIGPVVPPKFEFFDPSATSTHAQPDPTSQPEATTIVKDTVSTVDNSNSNSNVVELKFNGNNDVTTDNNKQQSSTSVAADVTYQSTGSSSTAGNVDITVSSLVPNENSSTEPKPTVVAIVEKTSSTLSSEQTSTSGSTETTSGQADATSTASTDSSSTAKQSVEAGGIAIPSFAMGDMNTGGMLVKVGMGASTAQPTQETPSVTSQANIPQESSTSNDVTTTTGKEAFNVENLAPIATLVRSTRPKVSVDKISRRKRQAGPPPPPPGSGAPPPPAPGPAGPDYAPKPQQQSAGTISFGGLIGDSFSRSGQTQHSFMSAQDFTQSMGGGGGLSNSIPGEALAEVSMTGGLDMTGYPPDMMLAPGPPGPGMDPMGGPLTESIFLDQTLPQGGGSLLDAPVDASPSSFIKPGIPRPPKQSSAELEAAIVGAPMLTSAVSDTQISTNAADLVGASYIPELSEGRSNQAETSTAARHGTMIVPVEFSKTTGGSKAEYLSGSKGTSMRETAADTRAEIRSATMSLARFGYQPTAEQVLSGNIGIHHPTENLDTTNLEPIGLGPNSVAGAAAPGILSAILGGQQTQVTDASLDPAVKKTREDLIRQLGEAMGVIGTSSNKGPSNVRSLISMDPSPAAPNPQEQQQIVSTGASQAQQIVDAQPGGMGISFDGGMFGGNSMMNMGMGMGMGPTLDPMTGGQVSGGGLDMFGGLGMDMQTMDLQSLFGAADAAVNNQPVALPQVGPQNMANSQSSLSNAVAAAQTQSQNQAQRQPQTPSDLIDIGMPGMTIEEMMTLLNMEQGGATGSTSGAAAPKQPSLSSAPSEPNVAGINMESAMLGETSSQSASAMSSTSSSSSSSSSALSSGPSSSMESMMFGTNSVNEKPSNSLIGLTAQSLSEMSTSNLEALLAEATGNAPTQERITNSASSSSVLSTGSSSSASSSALGPDALGPDALLTAPLDKLSTAELEALLNSNPAPEPTPSAVPITTSQASVDFGFAPEPTPAPAAPIESRETQMIKTALKRAVFDATGTEFDFSQMTQTEMNDMVQMFGGLQNLQQYMTPDMFAPEPVVEPVTPPPTPAPIVEQQPAVDPLAGNAAGMDTTNLDFATMQQFLNPTMFGADMANFGFGQQGTDLQSMMSALNPTGAPLNQQADTISLADLLSGNINMGQQSGQSSSMTVDQSSQTTGSMDMNFDQFAQLSGNMGQASQATQTNEARMTSSSSSSATSGSQASSASSQITGTENMIWDPVQMQWISPDGTLVKDTSAAVEQAVVQPATPDVSLVDQTQQQSIANEMGASSSSTSFTMETSMSGSMRSQPSGTGANTGTGSSTTSNISPIVGGLDTSMTVDSSSTSSVSVSSGGSIDTQTQGIASSSLSDLIPVGEQVSVQMTEKASPSTLNVDPSPTVSTAGSANVKSRVITTSSPVVESPRPPVGQPNTKEMILFTQEMKKKQELEMMLQRQRQELQRLEEQRIEQSRKMMAEKQRIEYEKQQLALRKQQMEVDALRQEQLRQRQMLEQQRKQLAEERMRIENQRLKELEMAKQKAIEEERRRIREEQQRLREIEMAKKQAAEMERRRIEAERRKNAQAELTRRRAAEAERLRIEEERKRLQEERMRQEAAAAAAAKAKAEAEAAAAAAAAAKAEIEAREAAAAAMVVGMDTGVVIDTNATGNGSQSFTPIGAVGGQLTDADAATAMAWQAVVKAAQIQATGGAADPNAMITQQQEQLMQHQNLMNAIQTGQGLSPEWIKILEQAAGVATTPAPTTPDPNLAAMAGMDPAALMQLLQGQAGQSSPPVTTPAPPTTTPKPKRKAPIRPDPNTRDFVRNMFIDNIKPGVDPLSILIGLTPEMLMKSGVNPLIANSADLARIVPAVERALGVSLKKIPVPTGPRGQPLTPQPTGFQMLNVRSDPGGVGGPADQRREFLMQQRMMGEMMTMLGLGPEPLEPGDPGYRGPGATPGRGGPAHGGGAVGGHSFGGAGEPLGGHSFGGAGEPMGGHSFGGAGDPMGGHSFGGGGGRGRARGGGMAGAQGGLSAQLEMLGL